MTTPSIKTLLATAALLIATGQACAQEAVIRKTLAERLPNLPKIDEISKSPVNGLYEVRYNGSEILYSDEKGEFIIVNGALVDTRTRTDMTQARVDKLLQVDFDALPMKDALLIRQGSGSRRMAVFVDPNCGYCKRFERDIASIKDVTIYTFLIPILGPDSVAKTRDIWCAKEPSQSWRAWMLDGKTPARAEAKCDAAAIDRNLEFARKQRINGTPAVFFADGTRKPGAIPLEQVEKLLAAASPPARK